ncbi:MAG: hypothetical protein R6V15_07905 [Desulfotignum sp.]
MTVIYKYLDCGDLHMGFARVRCEECANNPMSHVNISLHFLASAGLVFDMGKGI